MKQDLIYGSASQLLSTPFAIDKVYTSYDALNKANNYNNNVVTDDGVFIGRYVQIKYSKNPVSDIAKAKLLNLSDYIPANKDEEQYKENAIKDKELYKYNYDSTVFRKIKPGNYEWVARLSPEGQITINGTQLYAFGLDDGGRSNVFNAEPDASTNSFNNTQYCNIFGSGNQITRSGDCGLISGMGNYIGDIEYSLVSGHHSKINYIRSSIFNYYTENDGNYFSSIEYSIVNGKDIVPVNGDYCDIGNSFINAFNLKLSAANNSLIIGQAIQMSYMENSMISGDGLKNTGHNIKNSIINGQTISTEASLSNILIQGQDINIYCALNNGICIGRNIKIGSANIETTINNTFLFGNNLTNNKDNIVIFGQYNQEETEAAFVIGNGTSEGERKNLFVIQTDGTVKADGQKMATEKYVNDKADTKQSEILYGSDSPLDKHAQAPIGTVYIQLLAAEEV